MQGGCLVLSQIHDPPDLELSILTEHGHLGYEYEVWHYRCQVGPFLPPKNPVGLLSGWSAVWMPVLIVNGPIVLPHLLTRTVGCVWRQGGASFRLDSCLAVYGGAGDSTNYILYVICCITKYVSFHL